MSMDAQEAVKAIRNWLRAEKKRCEATTAVLSGYYYLRETSRAQENGARIILHRAEVALAQWEAELEREQTTVAIDRGREGRGHARGVRQTIHPSGSVGQSLDDRPGQAAG